MATLYEINNAILECCDTETGEILDVERLQQLQLEKGQKIEGVALYIKNLDAEAAALKTEEAALAERRKAKENKAKRLKGTIRIPRKHRSDRMESIREQQKPIRSHQQHHG